MKTGMKKRVVALALAALMVVGLVPTGFGAVGAKAAAGALTADAAELGNGMSGKAFDSTDATVDVTTNKMVINDTSTEGGVGSSGISNVAYLYIPVSLQGLYNITADVTVNEVVPRTEGDTQAGVFIGVTTDTTKNAPMISVAMRGDDTIKMYRQKKNLAEYGGSGDLKYEVGTKKTLGLERRLSSNKNKFYSTVDGATDKNSNDVADALLADDFSGYVFIAVSGANVTIENLKITNGDGTVVYDQSTITVGGGDTPVVRKDWAEVAAPVLGTPSQADTSIIVPVTMVIGDDGADKVTVTMKDSTGAVVATKTTSKAGTEGSVTFTNVADSGTYTFSVAAIREGEEDKAGEDTTFTYSLPLGTASILSATSKGNGSVEVTWTAVKEAESYVVEYSEDGTTWTAAPSTTKPKAVVTGLTVGKEYSFRVKTARGADSTVSGEMKGEATAEAKVTWGTIAYGNGIKQGKEEVIGNAADGPVTINVSKECYTTGGENTNGKIVPGSFDGIVFHYTTVPAGTNFTLSAKVTVDRFYSTNGQEGFGLVATDRLGGSGWNNQYMALVSKCEYYWDEATQSVTTSTDGTTKITNKIGVIAQEKKGLTKDNVALVEAGNADALKEFKTTNTENPLDKAHYGISGNLIGGSVNPPSDTVADAYKEMYLQIQKNNTGYFITFTDMAGNSTTKKFYVPDALEKLDEDNVYVGFFSSRSCDVTFSDIKFTTIDAKDDAPAEEKEYQKVAVNASVQSATATGVEDYNFLFTANCDGWVSIHDANGKLLTDSYPVAAGTSVSPLSVKLAKGNNKYTFTFVPDKNYRPDADSVMENYENKVIEHTVTFKQYGTAGQSLWVAPDAKGSGSKEDPMSIYDAVKYVQPGQQIIIKEGTYLLDKTVKVARGINGTAESPIVMMVDPDAKTRPVFDFQSLCAGMIFGGDYWYVQGFDVIHSANGQKAVQISGNNNVLDDIVARNNGSTGIQISRLNTTDTFEQWPANNLVLNCTAYYNHDEGDEDADGFAAKLTVGEGNVFDGCIAHHNSDDGWDLFAKIQTGSIGAVTIRNSVAYANGYHEDGSGRGNGNGFKMGGDSMSGYHVLENCIAFDNKKKGIDSNSCPDIQIKNSISFNNGSYNVALYTGTAGNTDYSAEGIISFRTWNVDQDEDIKPKGTQDASKIFQASNYFWNATADNAMYYSSALKKDTASYNAHNAVTADWFVSVDTGFDYTARTYANPFMVTRNADNTINMNGLLELKTGNILGGMGSVSIRVYDSVPTGDATPIALMVTLLAVSAVVFAGVVVVDKKKKAARQ